MLHLEFLVSVECGKPEIIAGTRRKLGGLGKAYDALGLFEVVAEESGRSGDAHGRNVAVLGVKQHHSLVGALVGVVADSAASGHVVAVIERGVCTGEHSDLAEFGICVTR